MTDLSARRIRESEAETMVPESQYKAIRTCKSTFLDHRALPECPVWTLIGDRDLLDRELFRAD